MIRKFLGLTAEIHSKDVTALMVNSYVRALDDVPYEELQAVLLETLRSESYWPTPGHIRAKLDEIRSQRDDYEEPKALTSDSMTEDDSSCPDCKDTTWRYVTCKHPLTGQSYQAVTSCDCTSRQSPSTAPAKAKLIEPLPFTQTVANYPD